MKQCRVIDLENHFIAPGLVEVAKKRTAPPFYRADANCIQMRPPTDSCVPVHATLTDLSLRLPVMDKYGIDVAVVSGAPIVEYLDLSDGPDAARMANDQLCEQISRFPDRFRGFACVYSRDPDTAVKELERCRRELGFVGWLAFSNNGETPFDDPKLFPLLEAAAELGMPIYLHPAFSSYERLYGCGTGMAAGGMGFTVDTSIALVRLVMQGVFDRLPDLQVMAGHVAEAVPYYLARLDNRTKPGPGMEVGKNLREPSYYFKHNIWATSAGNYTPAAFRCAQDVLGIERMLYGTDFPFIPLPESSAVMDEIALTEPERRAFYGENAASLLGI